MSLLKKYIKEQEKLYENYKKCADKKCAKFTKKIKELILKNKSKNKSDTILDIMNTKPFKQRRKCKKTKCKKEHHKWKQIFVKMALEHNKNKPKYKKKKRKRHKSKSKRKA